MGARAVGRRVRDIIGDPDNWPNYLPVRGDAVIVEVIASEDDERLIILSRSGSGGKTYTTFLVSDPELRSAIVRVIQAGMTIDEAMQLEI
jgi:hypothetical protein